MSCPALGTPKYWKAFADFCRYEKEAGGPDPHVQLSGALAGDNRSSKIWMGGCYAAVYNSAMAWALYLDRPLDYILETEEKKLASSLEAQWPWIIFRRERRAARSPTKLARCLKGYAEWATVELPKLEVLRFAPEELYEEFWNSALTIPTFGRYITFKLLEYLRRWVGVNIRPPDIRPRGADWPRRTLWELNPTQWTGMEGNSPAAIDKVNDLASMAKERLASDHGVDLDFYELETLLCEFRQMYHSHKFYPGRPQDSELGYFYRVRKNWPIDGRFLDARARLFPHEYLGEKQGWTERREGLGRTLHDHGYIWSDAVYSYSITKDLAKPIAR